MNIFVHALLVVAYTIFWFAIGFRQGYLRFDRDILIAIRAIREESRRAQEAAKPEGGMQ